MVASPSRDCVAVTAGQAASGFPGLFLSTSQGLCQFTPKSFQMCF